MICNQNPLALTIIKNIGRNVQITYKFGKGEETICSSIAYISDSHYTVMLDLHTYHTSESRIYGPKMVTTIGIPINNILSYRLTK